MYRVVGRKVEKHFSRQHFLEITADRTFREIERVVSLKFIYVVAVICY